MLILFKSSFIFEIILFFSANSCFKVKISSLSYFGVFLISILSIKKYELILLIINYDEGLCVKFILSFLLEISGLGLLIGFELGIDFLILESGDFNKILDFNIF